jgi:hypothetical protein
MLKASVMRLEWSETDVLCMGIICVSVCIPNCCSMSAFHKSTWRCYSSYSYMNCIFAFLFLILRPLFRYTKCRVLCCLTARMKKYTYSMCLFVWLFLFPFTAINSVSFPSLFLYLFAFIFFIFFRFCFFYSFVLCSLRNHVFRLVKINWCACKFRCFNGCAFFETWFHT